MPVSKNKTIEIARRRALVAEMYIRKMYQHDIAAELGVTRRTIINDLQALQKEWQESAAVNIAESKAEQLAKIDELERQAWDAWEQSKGERKISRIRGAPGKADDSKPNILEKTVTTEERTGNIVYWNAVLDCIKERCKILGLNAPEQHEHNTKITVSYPED